MLSMEACVSKDGSTVSYYHDGTKCSDLGLQNNTWLPEPFHHMWMALHGVLSNSTLVFALVLIGLLVLVYLVSKDKKSTDTDKRHGLV